jgi:hypothetical protein
LKQLINHFIQQNNAVLEFLENRGRNSKEADHVIPEFNDFLQRAKYNVALGLDYATILQLSNDDAIYSQYDLDDITRLFESLLAIQQYNLEAFADAAHFEYSVMGNNAKARKIAEDGIHHAQEKIDELQTLLHNISRDSNKGFNIL